MKSASLVLTVVIVFLIWVAHLALSVSRVVRTVQAEAHRDVELEYVFTAERCIEKGRAKEALEALEQTKVLCSNRGCNITLLRCAAHCMLEGNCDRVIGEVPLGNFTARIHDSTELHDRLVRYCEATKKYRGAGEAAKLLEAAFYLDLWLSPRSDLQLAHAQYCFEGGDVQTAANLCQRLWDDGQENNWNWSYVKDDLAFKRTLQELRSKTGEGREKWLTAREIKAFPAGFAIYLQPLGELKGDTVEAVRARIETFFGARTVVLPAIPLTYRERSYEPQAKRYNAAMMLDDKLKRMRIPADAFTVVMLTQEMIGTQDHGWIYSRSDDVAHLISSNRWLSWISHWQVVTIGNVAVSDISRQLSISGVFPCIACSSGNADAMRRVKYAYSAEAQEAYRSLDLEAAVRRSAEKLHRRGLLAMSTSDGEEK